MCSPRPPVANSRLPTIARAPRCWHFTRDRSFEYDPAHFQRPQHHICPLTLKQFVPSCWDHRPSTPGATCRNVNDLSKRQSLRRKPEAVPDGRGKVCWSGRTRFLLTKQRQDTLTGRVSLRQLCGATLLQNLKLRHLRLLPGKVRILNLALCGIQVLRRVF